MKFRTVSLKQHVAEFHFKNALPLHFSKGVLLWYFTVSTNITLLQTGGLRLSSFSFNHRSTFTIFPKFASSTILNYSNLLNFSFVLNKLKINLIFYFHTSLWWLKRFYEDLKDVHKTFWGTIKKCENKNLIFLFVQDQNVREF